jgi:hypothetical protein
MAYGLKMVVPIVGLCTIIGIVDWNFYHAFTYILTQYWLEVGMQAMSFA